MRHVAGADYSIPAEPRELLPAAEMLRRLLNEPPMQLAKGEFGGRVGIWRLVELFDFMPASGPMEIWIFRGSAREFLNASIARCLFSKAERMLVRPSFLLIM